MSAAPFDPLRILKTLARHQVRFVVIGGIAGRLWGSTTVTNDLDICYARDRANREALATARRDLKLKLRETGSHVKFVVEPKGSGGYATLARNAEAMDVGGVTIRVAALSDLIAMKRAAGRPKDLIEVEILSAVRDEIERE